MTLEASDFPAFFEAVHGAPPFPWQQALVERLAATDAWPDVLDIPTGCGKTAALDVALFHLALRADQPSRAAIRIVLVVDRRLVVDDAHGRAQKIADALSAPAAAVVGRVAERLAPLAIDGPPLVARRLRGGAPLEAVWARSPTQPTILCSTVDQVGSRLLFRGYGVSTRMAPVHAGLLGRDTLLLLDEAHLAEPFRQTLAAVQSVGDARLRTVLLTATPGVRAEDPFRLTPADHANGRLAGRIGASKPARLVKASDDDLVGKLVGEARAIMGHLRERLDMPPAVGVVVNRVALARAVFDSLAQDPEADAVLMIGRSRDVDREAIVAALAPFRTGADRTAPKALFVVATQCLEVGVDLDLDGLVTQAAALDALRQRFGRLDRAGRLTRAEAAIVVRAEDLKSKIVDPVYGDRIRTTWETLDRLADGGVVDMGARALEEALRADALDVAALAAPREDAPVLMPAYIDLWRRTSPVPNADPEVGLFLHGPARAPADVSVVWRRDLSETDIDRGGADVRMLLALAPPRAGEMLDLPVWTVRRWLRDRSGSDDVADVPAAAPDERQQPPGGRRAFRWAGEDDPRSESVAPDDIRPGDVVVVPAAYGGCDRFGWAPESRAPVADVADTAAWPWRGRRWAARVSPDLVADPTASPGLGEALASLGPRPDRETVADLAALVPVTADAAPQPGPREAAEALAAARGRLEARFPYGEGPDGPRGAVLFAPRGIAGAPAGASEPPPVTEDDRSGSIIDKRVTIDQHGADVASWVDRFTRALRLTEATASDLSLAARLHDLGKADRRFQKALAGGNSFDVPDDPPVAKSKHGVAPEAFGRAGVPERWRHEALSVRLARVHPAFAAARDPELVLWLIGVHHGLGRPFFGFADPLDGSLVQDIAPALGVDDWSAAPSPGPESPGFDLDGLDWPMLFETLARRYGAWGLAHLEAILRLADHRAS
ncbi:MAG: type I-U CRISPR-associated helicase/endonuclease Cas3, partial [Rhodobacteraceae bacterium]